MSYVLSFVYVGIYWNKLQYTNYPSLKKCRYTTSVFSGPRRHEQTDKTNHGNAPMYEDKPFG
jgi:hypothetical protein